MAGLCELAASLRAPIFGILRTKWPIVSGGHLKNSRFWEIAAGDRVRSALRGRGGTLKASNPRSCATKCYENSATTNEGARNPIRSEAVQRNRSVDMIQRDLPLSS